MFFLSIELVLKSHWLGAKFRNLVFFFLYYNNIGLSENQIIKKKPYANRPKHYTKVFLDETIHSLPQNVDRLSMFIYVQVEVIAKNCVLLLSSWSSSVDSTCFALRYFQQKKTIHCWIRMKYIAFKLVYKYNICMHDGWVC